MRKSGTVSVQIVSAVASLALAAGCGSRTPTHQKACGDDTGRTVDWSKCEEEARKYEESRTHGHGYVPLYHWYYGPYRAPRPVVGEPLAGFSRVQPTGPGVRIASPASARGGFGSTARPSGAGT